MNSITYKLPRFAFGFRLLAGCILVFLPTVLAHGNKRLDIESRVNIVEYTDSTFYEIRGLDFKKVLKEAKRHGPVLARKRYLAMLKFNYASTFRISDRNEFDNRLQIASANIVLRYKYILPLWVDYDRVSPEMQAKWDRYMEKVRMHETMHKEIYQEVFSTIGFEIEQFSEETSVDLKEKFNNLINKKMRLANRLNDDFHKNDKSLNNFEYLLE